MIAGLQKMTLLDYPGKVACTVFLQGCNFRCPFCHNAPLLPGGDEEFMTEEALMAFLQKRKGLLDAVCISGGEPTLYEGLEDLLRKVKALGYLVKLDTNGSRPAILRRLAEEKLLDYVAMDVKNCPDRYGRTVGIPGYSLEKIEGSLSFLLRGGLPFELRTTVVEPLHDPVGLAEMGRWLYGLNGGKLLPQLYLQPFRDCETVLFSGLRTPTADAVSSIKTALAPYVETITVRGM